MTRIFGRVGHASLAAVLAIVTFGAVGCQDAAAPPGQPEEPGAAPDPLAHFVAGPARDVGLIATKAVLGFTADGGAFRAGYTTHDVTVQDGVTELTPYHYVDGERITGGKLGLETGSITRDDGNVLGTTSVTRIADGAVEIARGDTVEVLANREDGVRQDWRFATAPAGTGDLTVEVQVTGQDFVAANASGLHFKSRGGLGFRYSHAVWVDAAGHEWPIQAAWQADHIAITVPEDILGVTQFPATLDPTVSAEVDIDAPVSGGTGANARAPAVAFDGTNFLVVWADQRLSRDDDIFAARVSASGQILSTTGLTINAGPGRQANPAVAFAGNQFVVVWEDFKVTGGTEADIAGARVSTAGVVTQLGRIASSAQNELTPSIAGNGNNALVAWANGSDIRASSFNGTSFGGAISITADAIVQSAPAVAARPGGNYLIAYSEGTTATADLKGAFVTLAGQRSGGAFVISAGAGRQFDPAAAFDGTNYVVAWTNNNAGINLFGARVSQAGAVLDTRTEGTVMNVGGVSISSVPNSNQELSSLACVTGACFVAWQESRNQATTSFDIYGQRLSTSGALTNVGAEVLVSTANRPQFTPAVTAAGSDFFAVWTDERDAALDSVFGARITSGGAVTDADGLLLVTGNNRENAPAVGRTNNIFGVLWSDSRNLAGSDIELVRFNGASKIDATARPVSSANFSQAAPAATSAAGGNFFVVWQDARNGKDRDIFGSRVTAAGAAADPNGIAIAAAAGDQLLPSVASNGVVSLVAWQDRRAGNFDIFAALVNNQSGAITKADIVVCNVAGDQGRPSVAFDGVSGQFLVVWADDRISSDNANIFGARVTTDGTVLDPNGVAISSAGNPQLSPRAAFLNGTALVVWEDRRLDTQGDIFGGRVRIGASLTVLDPNGITISDESGTQGQPAVATLAGSYLVAWSDGRDVNTNGTDIFAQQVTATGGLLGAAFAVAAGPDNEDAPAMADTSSNFVRIAYTRTRADLQTQRVETRTITTSGGSGAACSNDGQCSTGFCVDSRCCDTACGGNNKVDCQACTVRATGVSDGTCAFVIAGTICRNYANPICDLREQCTGTSPDCPPDIGRREGQVCNQMTGAVCPSAAAPGPHGCP